MIPSDEMTSSEEEPENDFLLINKKKEKAKEEILDETFKKAEFLKKVQPTKEKRKIGEKPFFKSGVILIAVAIVGLVLINVTPWMYVKYTKDDVTFEEIFYKDTSFEDNTDKQNLTYLFNSPCTNCTNNSQNYVGLTIDDFKNIPKITSYGFIVFIIIGTIATIFAVIDWFRKFSFKTSYLIYSIFAAGNVVVSTFIILTSIKLLASHFLLYYNWSFIETSGITDARLVFLAPILIIFLASAIMKGATMVLKMNIREIQKILESEQPEKSYSIYKYGRNKI